MQQFLDKLDFYADVSSRIVKGEKIDSRDYDPALIHDLDSLAARMYTGFFSPLEPVSLIIQDGWDQKKINDMGLTTIHPMMAASVREARFILDQKLGATVFGYNADASRPTVLVKGDFKALAQATAEIKRRIGNPDLAPFAPLIIQDRKFWGRLFTDEPATLADLKKYGIEIAQGADDTVRILEKYTQSVPSTPHDVVPLSPYRVESPRNVFASTDHIKTGHNTVAHNEYEGDLRVAHTVVGPSRIPVEETKTYAGNAFVKMVASMMVALNRPEKLGDDENTILGVHDGGVAFFLMNEKGERYTEIFNDPVFFAASAAYMNVIQAGPCVELAELYKSSPNFKTVMDALHAKVDDICKKDTRFKPSDLCGFDTAVQMSIPLRDFRRLYQDYAQANHDRTPQEICEHIAREHAVVVGDVQKVGVLRHPQYNSEPLSFDTEHYIEADGHAGKSRAQVPDWIQTAPNAASYRLMMEAIGAKRKENPLAQSVAHDGRLNVKIAVPGMLVGARAKEESNIGELRELLSANGINFRMGPEYWREFNGTAGQKRGASACADFNKNASHTHRKNIREILEMHDFLYIPKETAPATPREKLEYLLLICSAMVQRQVFKQDAPFIIMERGPFADLVINMFKSLKNKGLIGQRFEHLVLLTDGPEQSAAQIAALARMYPPKARSRTRLNDFVTLDEPENFTAAIYCSATNKNAVWIPDVKQSAKHMALNGIDLKLGGGSDGMMKAAADGYLEGLDELVQRGENSTGRLHLIQCDGTVTLEGDYELDERFAHLDQYIERMCCKTIEERRYILQRNHMPIGESGGIGTVEEEICELLAKLLGEKTGKLHLFSQSVTTPEGEAGHVYDFFEDMLGDVLKIGDVQMSRTVEELCQLIDDEKAAFDKRKKAEMDNAPSVSHGQRGDSFPALRVA